MIYNLFIVVVLMQPADGSPVDALKVWVGAYTSRDTCEYTKRLYDGAKKPHYDMTGRTLITTSAQCEAERTKQ